MAPITRATSRDIRDHLVRTMLDHANDTLYKDSLTHIGVLSLEDLLTLPYEDIESMVRVTVDANNATTTSQLSLGHRRLIGWLVTWLNYKKTKLTNSRDSDEWLALTVEEFDAFRADRGNSLPADLMIPQVIPADTRINVDKKLELDIFKRSIKRDASLYPTLREDKDWDNWNRSVTSLARTHDVSEVLDSAYKPNDEVSTALFEQKQSFMYSVFNRVLLTDIGKTIVRKYEKGYDAQKVYEELTKYAKTSAAANINIENIIELLTTMRLDSRWSGTNKGFVLYWRDQMRKYEDLVPKEEFYTEATKKRMIESAVRGVPELRAIKLHDDHTKAISGKSLSYENYVELLISAATRRDTELKIPPQRQRRSINIANSNFDIDSYTYEQDYNINLDTTYEQDNDYSIDDVADISLDVNATNRIPTRLWQKLPKDVQEYLTKNRPRNSFGQYNKQPNAQNIPVSPNIPSTKFARKANAHEVEENNQDNEYINLEAANNTSSDLEEEDVNDIQVNKTEHGQTHPGDIRNVLTSANKHGKKPNMQFKSSNKEFIVLNGKKYYAATTKISYSTYNQHVMTKLGSLVDRGANGGVAGEDVMLLETSNRTCDVSGINNHTIKSLPIVTCAGLVKTNLGDVIVILHQYAYSGKGNTIHSAAQLEHFGNQVDDKSIKIGGKQLIKTLDNYTLPLSIRNGLAYLDMSKPTQYEFDNLEHIVLTSDVDWDPSVLDHEADKLDEISANNINYKVSQTITSYVDYVDDLVEFMQVYKHDINVTKPNFDLLRPNFGYAPSNVIQKTFECTTQWARMSERYPFRKHFKSRFPALNVTRRNEAVATDTIFSDTPALANGCYLAQLYVGCKTKVIDVYPMKLESEFVLTLQDNIRHRGAMHTLVSDYANVETSTKVKDVLRHFCIKDWQSEPHHQHQNPAERRFQDVKKYVNIILDRTGAPPSLWFLCLKYVCYVLNLTYVEKLGTVPLEKLTGQTQDISILLPFSFYEPVYFATGDALAYNASVSFPSASAEAKGWFVGFGEHVGDALTFLVLTKETNKLIYRSSVRSALTTPPNLRLETTEGENVTPSTDSGNIDNDASDDFGSVVANNSLGKPTNTSVYDNLNLPNVNDNLDSLDSEYDNGIKDYNNVIDHLDHDASVNSNTKDKLWQFNKIVKHIGPIKSNDLNYKGSNYNLLIEWGDGSQTEEPLHILAADDPVSCAIYGKEHDLLEKPGWKRFKSLAKEHYRLKNMLSLNKSSFKPNLPKFKFGVQVPRTVNEAYKLDLQLNQTKWREAINSELSQINEYKTFKDLGKDATPPVGYKKIRVHFVFDIKHDGRHKARLVAGGHLTDEPEDSTYSSVVSLRDLRLVIFAAEQNSLDTWAADVGNAYLESYTKEKVYIIAGPEFNELQGHTLIISKALYGLKSSGLRWHERFADTLRDLKFKPSKASLDVWMRPCQDHYKYIAVYVDDLAIVSKNPKSITDLLSNKYGYKLKGVGPIDYHLGGNFARDSDTTLRYGPKKYIDKLMMSYTKLFGSVPKEYNSPLVPGDHPELEDGPELDELGIKQYQSMIGALQWTVTLGRFDILAAVMSMSRFRVAPKLGHLERLKRIYGYLKKFKNGAIRFRTNLPDYSLLVKETYDWTNSVYKIEDNEEDFKDDDMPVALGKPVITTTYVDANLMHCLVTGRASTGILHLVNGTPIDWYSKRQSTVQTATYGSEFVAARIATDQVIDLKLTLAYLGIKVIRSVMFGDNKSVVTSSSLPQSKLNKRHVALSYHRVREAIANDVLEFYHLDGKLNPADMLSKYAGNQQFWPILRSLLFWGGNAGEFEFDKIGDEE